MTPTSTSFRRSFASAIALLLSLLPALAQDEALVAVRENMPRVVLNKLVYEPGDPVTATVTFVDPADTKDAFLALILAPESTDDVEVVDLKATADPRVFTTAIPLAIQENPAAPTPGNNVIELAPNEIFGALLSYKLSHRTQDPGEQAWSGDWGILTDPNFSKSKVEVRPGLALTDDELNPPPGLPGLGTLFFEGEPGPVQVANEHLLFLPESDAQLTEFLNRTGAEVLFAEGDPQPVVDLQDLPKAGSAWLLVKLNADPAKIEELPQLRALAGADQTLVASNEPTLALVATAMALWCEGFQVGLEPRMQLHGNASWPEQLRGGRRDDSFGNGSPGPNMLGDNVFGFRQVWAFLAMFDYDRARVPVGVIDSGFAPNPDFKTSDPLYFERSLTDGTSGIGSAQRPQEVGNSFFGDKKWHGNGTVTTISGVPGNRFGTAGIGGQVAVPKLYHMGLANFAFGFGTAIRLAVDDGCSVINISAGYPCRILSVLGNDNICSPASRALFAAKLGAAVRGIAAAACAAAPLLDAFLPGLGAATCATAIGTAETAALGLFATVFLVETRTPIERAVAFATSQGVPVVASAGNRLSSATLGALAPFVDNDNSNIDDWQVIPAVIPEVIAVGACAPGGWNLWDGRGENFYANIHFWGDSIDIWAPYGSWYYAPEDGTIDPATVPASDHIHRTFGATSNAAPVVTGTICNLMAIDPSLDRRFAPASSLPGLPGRIRDLLVNAAYQAGDPLAPDSPDDVVTIEEDPPGSGTYVEIDEPAELVDQLARRRNFINAWAAVQEAADNVGVFDYAIFGYEDDLGRDDRLFDTRFPDGILEPLKIAPFSESEELTANDQEFWYLRTPNTLNVFRVRYDLTIPLTEEPNSILINGSPGTFQYATPDEQTLSWETPILWRDTHYPTTLTTRFGADTLYRLNATITTLPLPDPDVFDAGLGSNDTFNSATPRGNWVKLPPRDLLEVDAWELCVNELNLHSASDIDVFRINFPDPPLEVPSSCGALAPWVTIRVTPANSNLRIRVYSRSGGTDRLIARGSGNDSIRIDCRDYLGRLPLYVMIDSPAGAFVEYDLKVRWSEPDEELGGRLDRIREANAGPREIPFFERFFRPDVPWLFASPGLLPDLLVNPNPAFAQDLSPDGRFLSSRLFFVEIPKGNNGEIGFLANIGPNQSLRMEFMTISDEVIGSAATGDLGAPPKKGLPGSESPQSLSLFFPDLQEGVYILRLSGHRPGDQIALYLSESLNPPGGLSIEDLFNQQGQGAPSLLGLPPGFLSDGSAFTATLGPEEFVVKKAHELTFSAAPLEGYQVEILDEAGVWQPFGSPLVSESGGDLSVIIPELHSTAPLRIAKLGDSGSFPPDGVGPAYHLQFQSSPGVTYTLTGSSTLQPGSFTPLGASPSFTGDGSLVEWFYAPHEVPAPPYFFQIVD